MLALSRFFEIQFADKDFSTAELLDFSQDHLGRLAANNAGGKYDAMLAATGSAYEAFGGRLSNEKTSDAIAKARTQTKAAHRKQIESHLSGLSGTLHGTFGKDSPEYVEFFPQGLGEIRSAREADIDSILGRVVQAASSLLPESADDVNALRTTWATLYESATAGRATSTGASQSRQGAKENLQLQLTQNLLDLSREFIGQSEMATALFDESRLYNRQSGEAPSPEEVAS